MGRHAKSNLDPFGEEGSEEKRAPGDPQPSDPARAIESLVDPDEAGALDPTTQPDGPGAVPRR